jgi:threonine dehydrogenase-like Zn-dependent dehydrogenase
MGIVEEVGPAVKRLKAGDRIVVPFTISCGRCYYCSHDLWSLCDNSNPNGAELEKITGSSTAGLFGYSHLYGGYAGGQAQFVRVPYADYGPIKIESDLDDEQVLFLSDIFPTGFMAAENCNIQPGDTVAVWGCGPVGQFAIKSAKLLGAERVIAIDSVPERLQMAVNYSGATPLNMEQVDIQEELRELTGGRGPDSCIDAVGLEAHDGLLQTTYDRTKQAMMLETDRPIALRQTILACRKGGTVSVPGVYGGWIDKVPFGAAFGKGLTIRGGQTHMQKYMGPILERIEAGQLDPSEIITHRLSLSDAPQGYKTFREDRAHCMKVVMRP